MQDIVIFGAGGFGREIQWLIERINNCNKEWNILGYVDDGIQKDTDIDGYKILGGKQFLNNCVQKLAVVVAIGNVNIREKVIKDLCANDYLSFPNLVDPSVFISNRVRMGRGNIICAGTIITVDIVIGDFNIVNLDCTIGHDVMMNSFVTVYPSVNISGCAKIGSATEIGTGTQIIQGIEITDHVIIGAGSVVVKDAKEHGTYVGAPVRRIK